LDRQYIVGRQRIQVKLDELDEAPGPYAMSFGFDLKILCESIRAIGLVNPPCIGKDEKGSMEIISGYRRLLALKQMGWSEIACEDLSSTLPSTREKLLFALHENLASRAFNHVEKAMVLHRLAALYDKDVVLRDHMPLLSLHSHDETLLFYLRLAGMGHAFREAVAGNRLSLKAARVLVALDPQSGEALFHWISEVMLNFNQQMQFIDMLSDISTRERKSVARVLNEEGFQQILLNHHLNNPQKAKIIIDKLRIRRNPLLRAAENRFQESVDRLSLPAGVRIDHSPYFEAPGYCLEVHFRDGEGLVQKLRQIYELPALKAFGDPLFDDDQKSLD
jgi:hypothetical protein